MSEARRRVPRTGGGMIRVIARHAVIPTVDDPVRFCSWAGEVAASEAAEGWGAPAGEGVEVWFEGSAPAVEAMIEWCASTLEVAKDELKVSVQRPLLRGGFDVLEVPPGG